MLKYTETWNKTIFSKADNYMNEGCFQSASLCGKYPYIGDLYLQNFLILLYILWNTEAAILIKILPDATFFAFHWQRRFCENEYIVKIYTNIICNIFSGRFDIHLQVIQPILKFPYLILPIKYSKIRHLKYENHLKECHLWLTLKWIRQNTAFHRCLHSDALFGQCYTYLHVRTLAG